MILRDPRNAHFPREPVSRQSRLARTTEQAMLAARVKVFAVIDAAGSEAHEEHRARVIFARRSLGQRIRWAG